jgi:hypothetical protein
MRSVLVVLMVLFGSTFTAPTHAAPCQPAELFATDNTAVITDPNSDTAAQLQDGLQLFEAQADATLAHNDDVVTGSTLLDGFTWSPELRRVTYERSREFHLCGTNGSSHTAAAALRRQFHQQTVLTFDYLPQRAPGADSILVTAPGVDGASFRDALAADSAAHTLLPAGSVTTDQTLILVAGVGDLETAHRLVSEAGGNWDTATIAYGRRELVQA